MTDTARAVGPVPDCPDLETLERAPLERRVLDHIDVCDACQLVLDVLVRASGTATCATFEPLIAARSDDALNTVGANLLSRHLASCSTCRSVADGFAQSSQTTDAALSLPEVDPAAYALGLEIARGGMGRILAARDLRVGRPVAVKELLGRSRALAARFEREARVTARLQHPGIVPIYEIGRWPDGTPFYAMRMVDGRTLRDAIRAAPTLAGRLALLPAVIAASEAIAFAHAQRVIHRDLTPANVLVGAYGETVVIDWGIAKDLADGEDVADAGPFRARNPELTSAGAVIGTVAYMPPEQANAESVDERADVYALGAILYHVLAGVPPYNEQRGGDALDAVKTRGPTPVEQLAPKAPRDLISIVEKAMDRDRGARYPSARELADELVRFQTGRMVEAHEYTSAERMRRFVRRNRAAVIAIASCVVALSVTGGVAVTRVFRERSAATNTVTTLLEEKGRSELLAGHPGRALAFLAEAYRRGDQSAPLRFMLATAMREIDSQEATLDCGDDVREMAQSPDGTLLAAACVNVAKIWRIADHTLVATIGPLPNAFDLIRFSHDGRFIVTGGLDGTARAFDAATGSARGRYVHAGGDVRITWLGLTPDDARLVTTGFDGSAQIWDVGSQTLVHKIAAGQLGLLGVHGRLTPDGKTLVTATLGGVGKGWDVATGTLLGSLDHGSQILGGEVSPDNKHACTPGIDRRVKVWDLAAREATLTLSGHSDVVWKCVFSPDGTRLATCGNDGTAKVWDLRTGALIVSVDAGDIAWSVSWSSDGQLLATSSLDGSVKVWQSATGALLSSHDDPFGGKAAMFSRDGTRLIAQRGDGRIRIWSESGGPLRSEFAAPSGGRLVGVSSDGTRAVVARGWSGLEVWDTRTHARLAHETIAEPFVLGDRTIAASVSGGVAVIDLRDGHTRARIGVRDAVVLASDREGDRVVVKAPGEAPIVWSLTTGRAACTLRGAVDAMLSADGRRALAWPDATIWDVDKAQTHAALSGLGRKPRGVGFSRDGTRVAIHDGGDGEPRTLGVWRDDGSLVFRERVANDSARFDLDGELLTTIGPDNVIRVRRARDGELVTQFVSEYVSRAVVDPTGELVAAIDKLGAATLVLGARDGLELARRPVVHPPLTTTQDAFVLPDALAWWSATGTGAALVTQSGTVARWDARIETRPADEIDRLVRGRTPWRVRDGRLELTSGQINGRVTRDGALAANATISIAIREVPRLPAAMSWTTTMSQLHRRNVASDDDGRFRLSDVLPGEYTLIARSNGAAATSRAVELRVSDVDAEVAIELDRTAAIGGVVRDARGRGIAGARVVASCEVQPVDTGTAMTDRDGTFTIGPLVGDCVYEVRASVGERGATARVEVRAPNGRGATTLFVGD